MNKVIPILPCADAESQIGFYENLGFGGRPALRVTDPSGNTLYIGTGRSAQSDTFFRDLADGQFAALFAVLCDLVCSKEDCRAAHRLPPKLLAVKELLHAFVYLHAK